MRNLLDFVIIILIVAAISSAATRIYMIRTATPSTPCTIVWSGELYDYR